MASLSLPELEVLEDVREGDVRRVRLSIASTAGATQAHFFIERPAEVVTVALNGESLPGAEKPRNSDEMWSLSYFGPLAPAIELDLAVRSGQAVKMRVVEVARGLPDFPGQSYSPEPDYLAPLSCFCKNDSRMTHVSQTLTFG